MRVETQKLKMRRRQRDVGGGQKDRGVGGDSKRGGVVIIRQRRESGVYYP
jgi:hypothetical protein